MTTLTPIGDRLALLLDPEMLARLNIDEGTPLLVTADEQGVMIRPIRFAEPARVREAAIELMEIHASTLKRLAQ